ncbi:MAG: biliverdin-producing heme oxygenase [Pseudomonadota bacterium]
MLTNDRPGHVRVRLAAATDEVHNALHHHPVLGALLSADLERATYLAILVAYQRFFSAVETRRAELRAYPELNLGAPIAALDDDLRESGWRPCRDPLHASWLEDDAAVLGALYVLHGAGFGGRVLAGHVARSQPGLPRRFLQTGPSRATWRTLTDALDTVDGGRYPSLETGAQRTFAHLAEEVSHQATAIAPPRSL